MNACQNMEQGQQGRDDISKRYCVDVGRRTILT